MPHDFHATLLHLMGIDHERLTYRYSGRDFRLTDVDGNVVKEILASARKRPATSVVAACPAKNERQPLPAGIRV